jgi:signal transduction histidine kinase
MRIEYTPSSQSTQAVAKEVHRLLVILLDNAIKYGPKNATVRIVVGRRRSVVSISVADDGLGIPYADHKRIFDRFYRADASRQRQIPHEGFGLGLAIAREITRRNGGGISVESRPGLGSTFVVTFRAA